MPITTKTAPQAIYSDLDTLVLEWTIAHNPDPSPGHPFARTDSPSRLRSPAMAQQPKTGAGSSRFEPSKTTSREATDSPFFKNGSSPSRLRSPAAVKPCMAGVKSVFDSGMCPRRAVTGSPLVRNGSGCTSRLRSLSVAKPKVAASDESQKVVSSRAQLPPKSSFGSADFEELMPNILDDFANVERIKLAEQSQKLKVEWVGFREKMTMKISVSSSFRIHRKKSA
mmetsp:Transcript_6531/g.15841  ORF Transcript_6531/g.15841 Transcript_6531/m.15841 type:complete len:225 (+) Transcript_6531:69-743(+)